MTNKKPAAKKRGRPSSYSDKKANEILAWLVAGKSINSFCKKPGNPSVPTVYKWLADNESFLKLYTRAREDQADTLADEIIDIADTDKDANRARVRVDARKWVASKLKPQKYGDKNKAGEKDNPFHVQILTGVPRDGTADD